MRLITTLQDLEYGSAVFIVGITQKRKLYITVKRDCWLKEWDGEREGALSIWGSVLILAS